jgi:flagellar hook-length control protein FliK
MTIGPAIPGMPLTGEKVIPPAAEGAAGADMFGGIIAGMAAALGSEAATEEGAVAPEGEAKAPTSETDAAASLAQLLALTVRQPGKAKVEAEGGESADGNEPECELPALPEQAGEALPLPQPAVSDVDRQMPGANVGEVTARSIAAASQRATASAESDAKSVKPAQAPVAKADAEQAAPKIMAAHIADLLKAVAKPTALANGRHVASERTAPAGEPTPIAAPELRALVQAALSTAAPSDLPALHGTHPSDMSLGSLRTEPRLDASDFAVEHQLDMSTEGEWLDGLSKDIARIAGEGGTLRFKLNPENLGSLRVEITPQANGTAIRLTADTDAARAIIADAQPKLVAEARAAGLRISETHVDLGGQHSSGDPHHRNAMLEEAPIRTARFLLEGEESDGKPTRSQSERYA